MQQYEYRAIPAPDRAAKVKGIKDAAARHAHTLSELMNEMAAEGWEYLRADVLPCTERKGLTGTQTVYNTMLVFRRLTADALAEALAREAEATQARVAAAAMPVAAVPATAAEAPVAAPAAPAPDTPLAGVFASHREADPALVPDRPQGDLTELRTAGAHNETAPREVGGQGVATPTTAPASAAAATARPLSARVPEGVAPPLVLRRDADAPVTPPEQKASHDDAPDTPRRRPGWPFTH